MQPNTTLGFVLEEVCKRPIDVASYAELREYVWKRQARERTLIPIPAVKIDLSAMAAASAAAAAVQDNWGDDWGGFEACEDDGLVPSPWHDPSPGPWSTVGMGGAGDGFGNVDAFGKKPLMCYNCQGEGNQSFK